jgi:hypothetical protein
MRSEIDMSSQRDVAIGSRIQLLQAKIKTEELKIDTKILVSLESMVSVLQRTAPKIQQGID